MSIQVLVRACTVVATTAILAVATSGAASAHGMGMSMGHMSSGPQTVNLTQVKTANLSDNDKVNSVGRDRRRFRFISLGATYVQPVSTCFYKHTIWGLAKICPDLDVVN